MLVFSALLLFISIFIRKHISTTNVLSPEISIYFINMINYFKALQLYIISYHNFANIKMQTH